MKLFKRILFLSTALLILISLITFASADDLPREIEAIRKYIMDKEYPELFDKPYRVKLENALIVDLDNDGRMEVVALFSPHYRQSPPLVIYRLSKRYKVKRIKEGLAPGELVPVTGDYLDSHTLGMAIDFDLSDKQNDPKARKSMRDISLKEFGNVVEYRNFFHADGRKGKGTYIDMSHIKNVPGGKSCERFEFSRIEDISAGHLRGDAKHNYLAASVRNRIYAYRIDGFTKKGFLKKKLWVLPKPKDFKEFLPAEDGNIIYRDKKGKSKKFDFPAR